jgi:DNA/RNA-binding domain of Phe-tRNA-synthetase-like protein
MVSIAATDDWRAAHPGAIIGLLELSGIDNAGTSSNLNVRKREIEARVRARYRGFARRDLLSLPVLAAYDRHYGGFNKTYHLQLQIESIILKGKNLPDVSPAVDADFMAEVETLVLTAGHDGAKLRGSIMVDVSREGDHKTQMTGQSKALRAGDMIMRDADGICCSIIYGQDERSPIAAETTRILYVAYAPDGVGAEIVEGQLRRYRSRQPRLCGIHAARNPRRPQARVLELLDCAAQLRRILPQLR